MPEPVLYIRGLPQAPIEALATNPAMLEDLQALAGVSDEQVAALRKRLSEAKGFLDPRALRVVVRSVTQDDTTSEAVWKALRHLGPEDVERLLHALSERRGEKDFPLEEAVLDRLRQALPALIQPYPAMARFAKAERLARLTGQQLQSVELICDLRPIFDEDRKNLEGMMPYTRLCVIATGVDGLPKAFEAELTLQQVNDLAEKASKARDKLDGLRSSVEKWVPGGLPELPLTRPSRKESGDA